jgi:urocanate hydratase
VEAVVPLKKAGAEVFDYGGNIPVVASEAGYKDAFAFQGFVPLRTPGPGRHRPQRPRSAGDGAWILLLQS